MSTRNRRGPQAKPQPIAEETTVPPAEVAAPGAPDAPAEPSTETPAAPSTEQLGPQEPAPRQPDARVEVVTVGECIVDGCPVLEFEPGRGLCMDHFTTRLDLREVARHGG